MTKAKGVRLTAEQQKKITQFTKRSGFRFGDYIRAAVDSFQALNSTQQAAQIMALRSEASK